MKEREGERERVTHTHTHTCVRADAHTHTHMHAPTHACTHTNTHTHTHTHTHTLLNTCARLIFKFHKKKCTVQWLRNLSILYGCLALAAKPVGVARQQDVLQQSSHLFESDAKSNSAHQ